MEVVARKVAARTHSYRNASRVLARRSHRPAPLVACPDPESIESLDACPVDEDEIAELVARYAHRVRYFTHRIESQFRIDPQWHDDLISAGYWCLFKAVRNRREDAHERELSAYVSRRIEGAIIDEARRILNRVTSHADFDPLDLDTGLAGHSVNHDWEYGSVPEDPEDLADRTGRWQSIEALLEHLDADQRALLRAYADGQSLSEIARGMGRTTSQLQSELTRITRQIRAHSPELRRLLRHEI